MYKRQRPGSVGARLFFRGGDTCRVFFSKESQELPVYTQRKKRRKDIAAVENGLDAPVSEVPRGAISFVNESLTKQLFGARLVLLVPAQVD